MRSHNVGTPKSHNLGTRSAKHFSVARVVKARLIPARTTHANGAMGIFDDARKPSAMTAAGPSFPWQPPNLYQHLMELRAQGRLRDEDLAEMPDVAFIDKYGADAYWERTRGEHATSSGASGGGGHDGGVAEAMGGAYVRLPEPVDEYPDHENAPPESWHGAGSAKRAHGTHEAAKPRVDWSNPTLPTLGDIKAAGATRLEARNSPGFRALADRLQLAGERGANGGMSGLTRSMPGGVPTFRGTPPPSHGSDATVMLARTDGAPRYAQEWSGDS